MEYRLLYVINLTLVTLVHFVTHLVMIRIGLLTGLRIWRLKMIIDGVTILNNVTVSDFNPVPWLGVLIGLLVAFIIIYIKSDKFDKKHLLTMWCGIFTMALMFLVADIRFSKIDAIQCTIEDNVSINDVYDNYDVIDKQGEIWTLKEKTSEET